MIWNIGCVWFRNLRESFLAVVMTTQLHKGKFGSIFNNHSKAISVKWYCAMLAMSDTVVHSIKSYYRYLAKRNLIQALLANTIGLIWIFRLKPTSLFIYIKYRTLIQVPGVVKNFPSLLSNNTFEVTCVLDLN